MDERDSADQENAVVKKDLAKSVKQQHPWHFVFVGHYGQTMVFRRCKGMLITVTLVLFLAVTAAAILLFLYQETLSENQKLNRKISEYRQQIQVFQTDMDELTARVIRAEAPESGESESQQNVRGADETSAGMLRSGKPPGKEPAGPAETSRTGPLPAKSPGKAPSADAANRSSRVAIDDIVLAADASTGSLKFKFRIRNMDKGGKKVSGNIFLVLKDDAPESGSWIIFPYVKLMAGQPERSDQGRFFSIHHYKSMSFKLGLHRNADRFKKGALFVYDESGKLMHEKHFQIEARDGIFSIQSKV